LTETGPVAGSNPALGTTQALIDRYSVARNKYKPRSIGVLFIAESPPSSGGYFYSEKTIGKDHLFRETMKALEFWPSSRPMRKGCDKRSMLSEFRSLGFFLIDTCEFPVDKLRPRERRLSTIRGALTLPGRVDALCPDRILIVKKTVFKPAIQALSKTGFAGRVLNTEPLPFPSHGNQKKYRTMLRRLMKKRLEGTS
jgi:hypothetical protein